MREIPELTTESIERFWSKVDKKSEDECWEWLASLTTNGYGDIRIKNKNYRAHRVSWVLHNGQIPEHDSWHGYCVCHTCDNPSCVNPSHLFLGTNKDNVNDRINKKRKGAPGARGENSGCHKLTEKEVIEIRAKYIPFEYSLYKLAKEYGVGVSTIHNVVTHVTWRHV